MKYLFAILLIIFVVYGFFFFLMGIPEYGTASIFLAGLFGFFIYKICKAIYQGYKGDDKANSHSLGSQSYSSSSTYPGGNSSDNDEIDEIVMLDMMDGDLDGKFDIFDKD